MSDVIEVMARALDDGDYPMATYRRDVLDMLDAAEKAGWRLVPVEPTEAMLTEARMVGDQYPGAEQLSNAIQAAPRPWDEVER